MKIKITTSNSYNSLSKKNSNSVRPQSMTDVRYMIQKKTIKGPYFNKIISR